MKRKAASSRGNDCPPDHAINEPEKNNMADHGFDEKGYRERLITGGVSPEAAADTAAKTAAAHRARLDPTTESLMAEGLDAMTAQNTAKQRKGRAAGANPLAVLASDIFGVLDQQPPAAPATPSDAPAVPPPLAADSTPKQKPKGKAAKPTNKPAPMVPVDAFANQQLSLFQGFLANTDDERDALSNAIDLWDSIPRYTVPRKKQDELRMAGGFLPVRKVDFQYRGKSYTAQIRPARLEVKDQDGRPTGETLEHYPSAREELIEHALRKLAAEQYGGFFDRPDFRSGVAFTLHRLRQELANQGHAMTYEGLAEGLEVLHYAFLAVIDAASDPDDPSMISQPYLPALAKVNRQGRAADPDAKWFVQFHGLVTDSINQITYRQFNYKRLMKCSTQLARWLVSQLVLKYTQAAVTNSFQMRFSTIKRDSGLLNGYTRQRDALAALDEAWVEVKELGALSNVKRSEERGARAKVEEVIYTVFPSRKFAAEQKAANRRQSDAKTTTSPAHQQSRAPLLDQAKDPRSLAALVSQANRSR